ncbi:hypothetical protein BDV93DRAFT_519737 [Ceratobasidium sp. AG-I]|nr:hypothetical protein BDV93DRAFT_519737 [Ceratobasidium sp. AG-I]
MSPLPLLPEEVLRHICSFATSTDSHFASAYSETRSNYAFGLTGAQHNNRALGLATRRALNETSRLFHSLSKEFLFEDIILTSTGSVYEFADFLASTDVAWWVRRLKIKFASQWHSSTLRPAHAEGVARIISLCPRLLAFEDALESGAGGTAPAVFAALAGKPSLRAIGWTGQAYPSTAEVRDLLDSLPELEILHLQGCNPVRNGRLLSVPATPTSIQVPSLRSVTLHLPEMRSAGIFPILINAMVPSFTNLTLAGNFYFGGNIAAKQASLREFFEIHGPRLLSLDMRDEGQFTPVGPLDDFLAKCDSLKQISYPVAWTPPLSPMPKVETVGLRTITQELEVPQTALKCIDAHFEVLLSAAFPKLKTIQFLDDGMLQGYPELKDLAPHVREYLAMFSQRCSAKGIATIDSMGMPIAF